VTGFEVIPAIDLRGGAAVRLFQGDYDRETRYSDNPVDVARRWQELGAPRIHVVDLDGAREGKPVNVAEVEAICRAVSVPIEVSGGLRTIEDIEAAFERGAARVQLGSIAVKDPALVETAATRFPGALVVSIDARGGEVMTQGWLEGSGRDALDFAREMVDRGVPRVMVTDIGRDGAMGGPNVEFLAEFVAALPIPVVASGGVTAVEHIRQLAAAGCEGAIIGRALYEGVITLPEAIAAAV
jgi:phosphoribosylformimino-5-aminoimidazole carboxamide ribotide isomerase